MDNTLELVIEALNKHITLQVNDALKLENDLLTVSIALTNWMGVTLDEDVVIPIQPYSTEEATMQTILRSEERDTIIYNEDDNGDPLPTTIKAGDYAFIDPLSECFDTANERRLWPLTLRDSAATMYTSSEEGVASINIPTVRKPTHRDTDSNHVAWKAITLLDLLLYLAADEIKSSSI